MIFFEVRPTTGTIILTVGSEVGACVCVACCVLCVVCCVLCVVWVCVYMHVRAAKSGSVLGQKGLKDRTKEEMARKSVSVGYCE